MTQASLEKTHFHTLPNISTDITFLQRSSAVHGTPTPKLAPVCETAPQAANNHCAEVQPPTGVQAGSQSTERGETPGGATWRRWHRLAPGPKIMCSPGRADRGSYLSHGPMCRLDWFPCFWALAQLAPQAKVVSGGHQPGRGSSGAGCTWGALCRTRPQISSRPEGGDTCLEPGCRAPPCSRLPRRPPSPLSAKLGCSQQVRPASSSLPLPRRLWWQEEEAGWASRYWSCLDRDSGEDHPQQAQRGPASPKET